MLTIATFLWRKSEQGFQLPSMRGDFEYGPEYVLRLQSMLRRHAGEHRFVCITDQQIDGVECLPLWDDLADLGGCYRRLKLFDPAMRDLLGPRFMAIDLDVVITADIRPLMERPEPIVLNAHRPSSKNDPDQHYNGGLILMDAGCRPEVWRDFDPVESPRLIESMKQVCVGTDQAWIRLRLSKGEARFTEADGVYECRQIENGLPADARVVLFSGPRDPSTRQDRAWVRQNWQ